MSKKRIDTANARRLAVAADCDPRTIAKALRGEKVRGMTGERAMRALTEAGYIKRGD